MTWQDVMFLLYLPWSASAAMRGRFLFAAFLFWAAVAPGYAATFTEIQPPPGIEGDTLSIVSTTCPTCVRVPDALELTPGYWILAFEDRQRFSDRDFNDLIGEFTLAGDGTYDWFVIATYSAATHVFGFNGLASATSTGDPYVGTAWSEPAMNASGVAQVAKWTRPADLTEVPEPNPILAVLGCLVVAWWTWKGRR